MAMKILDLYRSILKAAHLVTTSDDCVSLSMAGQTQPALIKGQRLVLPSAAHLANPDKKSIILFHPLSENLFHGESKVLEYYRSVLNHRLNYTFGMVAYGLLSIATSPAEHKDLSPDQSEFLSKLKHADEKTLHVLEKLQEAMPAKQTQKSFIAIFLKKGGKFQDKGYGRVGIVNFPLYKELKKNEGEVYGVKMRVKDREALIALMEYMLHEIDVPEAYNFGSNSKTAPFMEALMKAMANVASPLNDVIELFADKFDDPEDLKFDSDWVETFENLDVMIPQIRSIPMQAGNEGNVAALEGKPTSKPAAEIGFSATPTASAPAIAQYPWQATAAPAPVYQQPAPVMQPVINSNGALDFSSIVRSNPALQQQLGSYNAPQQFQQPQQNIPGWARGANQWGQPTGMMQQQPMGWGGGPSGYTSRI